MIDNNLIYDIGMFDGSDTEYYLSQGFHVVSVDASPVVVQNAGTKFKDSILKNQLVVINKGIADKEDELLFYLNPKFPEWSSFNKEIACRNNIECDTISVSCTTIDKIIEQHGLPYYLKIDIEGNDIHCIDRLGDLPELPKFISAEVNYPEIFDSLQKIGYTKFKIIEQFNHTPLEIPGNKNYLLHQKYKKLKFSKKIHNKVLRKLVGDNYITGILKKSRNHLDYEFKYGSSGPFGEKTEGSWYSYSEIKEIYNYYWNLIQKSEFFGGFNFWIDVHASY